MRVLVVGLGEVGNAIYELARDAGHVVYGYDSDESKRISELASAVNVDVLHICYPYSKDFIDATISYIRTVKPDLVIIESTVPPGTTERVHSEVGIDVVHSPIRGRHPKLKEHIRFWTKWVGAINREAAVKAKRYYESLGLRVRIASSPRVTELAKLIETVYRALLIAWWQEVHRMCREFNVALRELAEFIVEVHGILKDRPIYYPGVIGGHCLIPNTRILREAYSSEILDFILESNERRINELEDPEIRREVEELKELWREVIPRWYYE